MQDNNSVTHGLHWLTLGEDEWECVHPSCDWHIGLVTTLTAQRIFDGYHARIVRARG